MTPRFGADPLPRVVSASAAMRRVLDLMLSIEHDHPALDDMAARLGDWERALTPYAPRDREPRFGPEPDGERRLYVQRVFDVGTFNPCFPEYRFDRLDGDSASGEVTFTVAFEGPPGFVHGGFVGVFFDCVVQHHNCAGQPSGMTRSMTITYRRPVPLYADLRFDIARADTGGGVTSTARLLQDDTVLCVGEVKAVPIPPERLAGLDFGVRRAEP